MHSAEKSADKLNRSFHSSPARPVQGGIDASQHSLAAANAKRYAPWGIQQQCRCGNTHRQNRTKEFCV